MGMLMERNTHRVLTKVLSFFVLGVSLTSWAQPLVNSKQALSNWIRANQNNPSSLSMCVASARTQYQAFLILNPSLSDPNALQEAHDMPLLQCLYGIDLVNLSLCIGHPSGCTPVSLVIPRPSDFTNQNQQTSVPTFDSVVY